MNNTGTEGFNYKELEDGVKHYKTNREERDNMSEIVEQFAREVAEDYAEEIKLDIISKLLRKGKDAEEVADLLDMDIEKVRSVEEGMLVKG